MPVLKIIIACTLSFILGADALIGFFYVLFRKESRHKRKNGVQRRPNSGAEEKKPKKSFLDRFGTMNLILVVIAISLLVFVIVMIELFKQYGTVPDTLITCVFVVCGTECGAMSWIRTNKDKIQQRKWDLEDEKRMDEKAEKFNNQSNHNENKEEQ